MRATVDEVIARLDAYTVRGPGDCLLWTANSDHDGYGWVYFPGWSALNARQGAHVFAFLVANGLDEVPEGMEIDHECRRRLCCNPNHLQAICAVQNGRQRSVSAARSAMWSVNNQRAAARRQRIAAESLRRLQAMGVENLRIRDAEQVAS